MIPFCNLFIASCISINSTYSNLSKEAQQKVIPLAYSPEQVTYSLSSPADVRLMAIDSQHLAERIKSSQKLLKWVLLYSEGCSGTSLIMPYVKKVFEEYGADVDVTVIATDDYYGTAYIKRTLFKHGINLQTYIVDNKYGEFKDYRQKGFLLRNQICIPCRGEVIGVPYNIVFDANGKVVYKGYRKYTRVHDTLKGADFIGDLLQNKALLSQKS